MIFLTLKMSEDNGIYWKENEDSLSIRVRKYDWIDNTVWNVAFDKTGRLYEGTSRLKNETRAGVRLRWFLQQTKKKQFF